MTVGRRGLTLLEVLVALLIASIGAAALARSAEAVARGRTRSDAATEVSAIAERMLEEILAADPAALEPGTRDDDLTTPEGTFTRHTEIVRGPLPALLVVRVTVTGADASISLSTLVRRPFEDRT